MTAAEVHTEDVRRDAVIRQTAIVGELANERLPADLFAFQDGDEIGPKMLARIGKRTGFAPEDL